MNSAPDYILLLFNTQNLTNKSILYGCDEIEAFEASSTDDNCADYGNNSNAHFMFSHTQEERKSPVPDHPQLSYYHSF